MTEGVLAAAKEAGVPLCCNRVGSMFTFFFTETPVVDWETAKIADTAKFGKFFHHMLENGVYLAPSQFEAGFMSFAHSAEDVQRTVDAAKAFFAGP